MRPSELVAYFKRASIDETEKNKIERLSKDSKPDGFFSLRAPGVILFISNISQVIKKRLKNEV